MIADETKCRFCGEPNELFRQACRKCGGALPEPTTQMSRPPMPPLSPVKYYAQGSDWLSIALAFFVPIAGVVLGIVWLARETDQAREKARDCLIAAGIGGVLSSVATYYTYLWLLGQ